MGLVLDSSVLIAAERDAKPVSELLAELEQVHGETEIVLSSITVIELEHGFYRAKTADLAQKRRDYLNTIFVVIPVEPLTREIAQLAAKIDVEAKQTGRVIPFSDLLIGVTALYFNDAVGTRNMRHFQMISGVNVIQV
ncbi:MAG TPA: PIN domain-containing protein [Bryobacteraceae bacterium]|nr:PIN domain-containing protein [Bryobacteraceae bacterium]